MNIAVAIPFLAGLLALASSQNNPSTNHALVPSIGLDVGQRAPAFAQRDQFGREQSNDTLKGPKGTVILFFRSADW